MNDPRTIEGMAHVPADRTPQPSTPPPLPPSLPERDEPLGWMSLPQMRYPNEYVWFIFFSSLDVMLTWAILYRGGSEVNPIAWLVIEEWGLPGAILFKFSLTMLVIIVCEVIARRQRRLGLNVAQLAVFVSAIPVMYSFLLLIWHTYAFLE